MTGETENFAVTSLTKTLILFEPDEARKELLQVIVLERDLSVQQAFDWGDAMRLMVQAPPLGFVFSLKSVPDVAERIRQLKQRFPEVPLLGIHGPGVSDTPTDLLLAGLFACLDQIHLADEFTFALVKLVAGATESYSPFQLKLEERKIVMPNDFALVMPVSKTLVEGAIPTHEKNHYRIILGLSEVLTNAIEHGNLGINYNDKTQALKSSHFYTMAMERAKKEPFASRVVTIICRVFPDPRRVEYHVADQGSGFDWRKQPDPQDAANQFSRHGRGLLMVNRAFDDVAYNEKGNEVTLTIHLDSPQRKPS